jgi:5-methylcytosine-specific restriction endonuclease McrA
MFQPPKPQKVKEDVGRGRKKGKRKTIPRTLDREIAARAGGRCEYCGHSFSGGDALFGGKKLGSHIHHIDGNRSNNQKANLILLCPNCHDMAERGEISVGELKTRITGFRIGL